MREASKRRGLTGAALKLIAAAAMVIDHVAWYWFPADAAPGFIMHIVGRITAPIVCYFIAEGYFRTRSVPRYALRLLVFAIIAQFPYCYYLTGQPAFILPDSYGGYSGSLNMLFTLLLGLLALSAMCCTRLPRILRVMLAGLCCAATYFCDWPFFAVMFIIAFGARRGDRVRQSSMFIMVCAVMLMFARMSGGGGAMYQAGVLLALPLLWLYNGERGGGVSSIALIVSKYAFYAFYPLHLLILALAYAFVN